MEYAEFRILPEVSIHSAVQQRPSDSFQSDNRHDTDSVSRGSFIDTGLILFLIESCHLSVTNCDPVLADVIPM